MNSFAYKTSMFQYMEIFESPCIETRRFTNLHVSEHGDSILSQKVSNTNFKIAIEERKLNLLRKNFNNMPLHTLVIDILRKKNRKSNIFF